MVILTVGFFYLYGMKKFLFRKILKEEVPLVFDMIIERVEWMEKEGIRQWNVTSHLERYPLSYYEKAYQEGKMYSKKI